MLINAYYGYYSIQKNMDKSFLLIIASIVFLIGFILWNIFYEPDIPLEASIKSTTLPLSSNKWIKIDLEEGNNSATYVLELKHGWLVYRSNGFGGGMAFVPKPTF